MLASFFKWCLFMEIPKQSLCFFLIICFKTPLKVWLPGDTQILLQGEKDDKIIAVCADDPEFRHYKDIKEIPPHRLAEIRRFFEDCIHSHAFTPFIYNLLLVIDSQLFNTIHKLFS